MSEGNSNIQRAIVFQGGGALGAYEAGTYQQIYRKARKESPHGRLFDIIAGTSIGAINSSVLVGHYLKNNSWDGSVEKLFEFWEGLMCPTSQTVYLIKDQWDVPLGNTFVHSIET